METMMMAKSTRFHPEERYVLSPHAKPRATTLMHISKKKTAVKTMSAKPRQTACKELGSFLGDSRARLMDEHMITAMMSRSNHGFPMSREQNIRTRFCGPNIKRE